MFFGVYKERQTL